MATKDGGPAFPLDVAWVLNPGKRGLIQATDAKGMTLRDYFAAQALALGFKFFRDGDRLAIEDIGHYAYAVADAMLAEREK